MPDALGLSEIGPGGPHAWMVFKMVTPRPGSFYCGQPVKVLACALGLPEHAGQPGTFAARQAKNCKFTVYLNSGICQAAEIEALTHESPIREVSSDIKRRKRMAWIRANL